jgi:hypothetical protein
MASAYHSVAAFLVFQISVGWIEFCHEYERKKNDPGSRLLEYARPWGMRIMKLVIGISACDFLRLPLRANRHRRHHLHARRRYCHATHRSHRDRRWNRMTLRRAG